ncbi:MAG: low-complexity tail membrane protein [Cyanophyceae cyanobacterium]
MATHRKDPFLLFHLAALTAVPVGLEACLLGFAAGDPLLPGSLDCLAVGILGAVPVLALQWFRPIYPFSVPLVSLRPASLSARQLRVLTVANGGGAKGIALTSAILGLFLLRLVYRWAPIAAEVTPFDSRWAGLGVAIAAFLLTSLWLQMGLGAALALAMPGSMINGAEAFPVDEIDRSFFRWGIPLSRILPVLEEEEAGEIAEEMASQDSNIEEEGAELNADDTADLAGEDEGEGEEVEEETAEEVSDEADDEAGDKAIAPEFADDSEPASKPDTDENANGETTETVEAETVEAESTETADVEAEDESATEEPVAAASELSELKEPEASDSEEPDGEEVAAVEIADDSISERDRDPEPALEDVDEGSETSEQTDDEEN